MLFSQARTIHVPVLQKEVLKYLNPKPNENFIDCTIDGGGHSLAVLEMTAPKGKILGIDWDKEILKQFEMKIKNQNKEFKKRLILINDNFSNLKDILNKEKFHRISGILLDLGMSSWHLKESKRGFTFMTNEPLDMRYSPLNPLTAEKIINYWSEGEIERILKEFGEEMFAKKIAREIINSRGIKEIKTTFQLVEIIKGAVPPAYQRKKIHFATKTFQALRIAVNEELDNLKIVLTDAVNLLDSGGRMAIISFHSLEDRLVKNFFKNLPAEKIKILTKKPILAGREEIKINPRSRSAKLRAVLKL